MDVVCLIFTLSEIWHRIQTLYFYMIAGKPDNLLFRQYGAGIFTQAKR